MSWQYITVQDSALWGLWARALWRSCAPMDVIFALGERFTGQEAVTWRLKLSQKERPPSGQTSAASRGVTQCVDVCRVWQHFLQPPRDYSSTVYPIRYPSSASCFSRECHHIVDFSYFALSACRKINDNQWSFCRYQFWQTMCHCASRSSVQDNE